MKSVRIMKRWRGNGLQHRSLKRGRTPPPRPQVILPARPAPAALSLLDGGRSHRHPPAGLKACSYDLSASTMRALLLPTRRMHLTTPAPSLYVPRGPPPALGLSGRGPPPPLPVSAVPTGRQVYDAEEALLADAASCSAASRPPLHPHVICPARPARGAFAPRRTAFWLRGHLTHYPTRPQIPSRPAGLP